MPTSKKSKIKKTAPKMSKPAKKPPAIAAKKTGASLEGKKAPAFQLADANGKTVALKDLLGANHLVLYFYPKDMTPGCTIEACSFRDNNDRLTALGARVIGIERTTFVIDKAGVVRRVFAKVKVNGHTDEVIEALQALE